MERAGARPSAYGRAGGSFDRLVLITRSFHENKHRSEAGSLSDPET
jgi:hypothetical protein